MQYEAVIGLEVHIQVRTKSKMFCSCPNRFGAEPNTLTCPVCLGYPGTLPVPNHEAIIKAVKAGLLTGCKIAEVSKFDRKSYFYPDLAKNYQISQYDMPFCTEGHLDIGGGKGFSGNDLPEKTIGITRIHLEEDPAKLTHFGKFTGADYNRSGVPLLEIVSEPDMRTADEAYAYLTGLKEIMRYGGIGDCDMEKGQMRCDVNISLRPVGQKEFGTKIEIKNLNSFRAAHRAVEYEMIRQAEELDAGHVLRQETRGWNDDHGETYLMRTKEEAHDYRYFPDPDLMEVR
ncbi:MAG: Asp-tRNA(Asn)/Glu-tRNA(Gln) amidotransferase subunit GatB, partial [Lentisphaeria bacterium]|nr:Asp-tRNA(Asn)/Glu-tRNA(Gln) amidotransferase subunit GatB [Lentisphaeria bacterium]